MCCAQVRVAHQHADIAVTTELLQVDQRKLGGLCHTAYRLMAQFVDMQASNSRHLRDARPGFSQGGT